MRTWRMHAGSSPKMSVTSRHFDNMHTEADGHLATKRLRVWIISWCVLRENALSKVAAGTTLFLAARKSTQAQAPGTELCYWPVGH